MHLIPDFSTSSAKFSARNQHATASQPPAQPAAQDESDKPQSDFKSFLKSAQKPAEPRPTGENRIPCSRTDSC